MLAVMHPQQHFQQGPREDFPLYPDPPTNMDMTARQMPAEAYSNFQIPLPQDMPTGMNPPVGFEPWTDGQQGFFSGQASSPSIPSASDEADLQVVASNLSSASAPSASSSTAGSPQSYHGQLSMGEWHQNHGGLSIVGQDYYPSGTEYQSYAPGMEEFPLFEMSLNKPGPGFGESQNIIGACHRQQHPQSFSVSSPTATIVPSKPGLEPDLSSPVSLAAPQSRRSSLAFAPLTPTSASFPSPPQAGVAQRSTFFSQSSGHFVAPLESSCWFFLYALFQQRTRTPVKKTNADFKPGLDPTTLHPDIRNIAMAAYEPPTFQQQSVYPPPSPAMSSSPQPQAQSPYANGGFSQQYHHGTFQPPVDQRRQSIVSGSFSVISHEQPSHSGDESGKEKQRCPHPDCGKIFKDLKAHMLTHQTERPEKCPITTCDYHVKGFARKYDKNRHTLTHYKGTMVCGFCPGSGSPAEKSFNRADVFKRHLTAVHGVEQTPPNSRKKTCAAVNSGKKLTGYAADATGKCSTCSSTFSNAQDFYEHLDDCVLRIVQQEDPAEAINAKRLAEVENDKGVLDTLEKNHLPTTTPSNAATIGEEDEEDVEMVEDEDEDARNSKSPVRKTIKTGPANGIQKSKGLTHSRGGVSLPTKGRARKNRRDYPSGWGFDKGQMTMKKRIMAVFNGQRRLAKDDMMLSTEHEVRLTLPDGKSYVTDLDVQTMKRAEGFHGATEEEKGPWLSDDPTEDDIQAMLRMQQQQQQQQAE
ncbi:hypothetical protein MKZ38_000012 [Zalerion maritima]|uniref:C2H2-type domain-containing protein n=1 Tax=Zalerion maritima TaxID=339359 RepID=A0AAD5RF93_9PEZI|nr:hypothetical protein MKZ38_000012 [Zalerion maritima]